MSFQYTIKKCLVTVDRKKYTKNEISIGDRYMFIRYSKPGAYDGKIIISMKNPSEQVSKIKYDGANKILSFQWQGPWEDYKTGKESETTLDFKIDFERSIDGMRVYLLLIGKPLDGKWKLKNIKKSKTKRRKVRKIKDKKSKKKGRKGPEESATEFKVGFIKKGNDGNMWIVKENKNRVKRWVKNQKGGTLIGNTIVYLPLDAEGVRRRVFHEKNCKIYDMKDIKQNLREHNYEYFFTGGNRAAIDTIAENPTPVEITEMLSQPFFREKINEYIEGDIDKLIVLHVLKRDTKSAAFFPNLHTDYDRDIGIGEGCIKMCNALKDDQHDYMPDVSYIQDQIGDTDDSKLYPLNLWSLLACNGGQLNNDNLCFYSLGNILQGHKPEYSTSGVSYMLRTELPPTLSLHTYDNLPADGSGYLFNSREIPHCSIHFPDRSDSNRTSIEIRIMIVKK
jgi:hypothetical protein